MFSNTKDSIKNSQKIVEDVFDVKKIKKYIEENNKEDEGLTEKQKEAKRKKEIKNLKQKWPAIIALAVFTILLAIIIIKVF